MSGATPTDGIYMREPIPKVRWGIASDSLRTKHCPSRSVPSLGNGLDRWNKRRRPRKRRGRSAGGRSEYRTGTTASDTVATQAAEAFVSGAVLALPKRLREGEADSDQGMGAEGNKKKQV
ncbi:MAG: hypothetical protein AAB375_01855 [Patescibacteria group bacterium]